MGIRYLVYNLSKSLKIQLFLIFLLMIFTAFTEILTIGSIIPFIAAIIDPDKLYEIDQLFRVFNYFDITPENISNYALILFLLAVIIVTITNLFFLFISIKFSQGCALFLSEKVFKNYINDDYEKILGSNSAHLLSSIIQKNDSVVSIIQQFLLLLVNILILIFIGILVFFYSPAFTLYSISTFVLLYFIFSLLVKSSLKNYSIQTASLITKRTQILSETFRSFRQVILDNSRKILEFIFLSTDKKYRRVEAKTNFFTMSPRYFFEGIGMIIIATVAIFIKNQNIFDSNELLTYLALLGVSAQRALPKINQAYTAWSNITATKQLLVDVNELAFKDVKEKNIETSHNFTFKKKIKFKNVNFSYANTDKIVLENINLEINKGEKIIIKGESGSGKSTFLDLFLGLLIPTSGEIQIDENILNSSNILNYQRILSSIAQTPSFLDASIKQNIVFYINKENIDQKKLEDCTKKAEIYDFIQKLNDGFESLMGENGLQLSGGQRQRISIARALYRKHEILVCDEATNSLDPETEIKVINNLIKNSSDKTMVFVTHNKEIIDKFDKTYTILNGKLVKN